MTVEEWKEYSSRLDALEKRVAELEQEAADLEAEVQYKATENDIQRHIEGHESQFHQD